MTDNGNKERVFEELTDKDQSVRQIAQELNLSEDTVKRWLRWLEYEGRASRKPGKVSSTTEDHNPRKMANSTGFDARRTTIRTPDLWTRVTDSDSESL